MSNEKLFRKIASTSRSMEFFSEKELTMQIGINRHGWATALLKELIDNALDAVECAANEPTISIIIDNDFFCVRDNGPGLKQAIIEKSLDYSIRISDKSNYVSPSRGQLGNALKCVWAAPFVATEAGHVEIETNGQKHTITVTVDRIKQEPVISHTIENGPFVENGTFVKLVWENVASYLNNDRTMNYYDLYNSKELIQRYILFNPHVTFNLNGDYYSATGTFNKWTSDKPISPHWYTVEKLKTLTAGYLASGEQMTVRAFVSEFKGLTTSTKQKTVVNMASLNGRSLSDMVTDGDIDEALVSDLLSAMNEHSTPIKPRALGVIGKEHFIFHLRQFNEASDSPKYKMIQGVSDGLPFLVEVGFIYSLDYNMRRFMATGINWTPLLSNPFYVLDHALNACRVDDYDPCMVIVHLACPKIDFTDRGKSRASLPDETSEALSSAIKSVTSEWVKVKRKSDRDGRMQAKALTDAERDRKRTKLTVKDAAYQVMEKAYLKASNNGTLPANARQIMYAARGEIIKLTEKPKPWSDSATFTQVHLPNFMDENPKLTASWDVVFDARGHFMEPHTGLDFGIGTLEVRRYINQWIDEIRVDIEPPEVGRVITSGAANRFNSVLFVEKEGFNPLLQTAKIAERFDIAIMSTKGMSVTAARRLIERLSENGVKVLVAHDFDKAGFSIVHTLCNDTRRYKFKTPPNVVDIGLTLKDAEVMGLEAEDVHYSDKADPRIMLKERGASDDEANFLVADGYSQHWQGERIELNAMTSEVFIAWLERKFKENGVEKFIPGQDVLETIYKRSIQVKKLQKLMDDVIADFEEDDVEIPQDLQEMVTRELKDSALPWDKVIRGLV